MTMLLCAENVACAADFEVAHCNLEAGAKFCIFPDCTQAAGGDFTQFLATGKGEVGIGPPGGAPHAPADLMQLCKAQPVGVFDN